MTTTALAFPKDSDLSGLRIEQNAQGYALSPWWTFSLNQDEKDNGAYNWTSRYHAIVNRSKEAFSQLVGIRVGLVMVSEKRIDGEIWWRLSTGHPVALPKPKKPERPILPENRGAIDI